MRLDLGWCSGVADGDVSALARLPALAHLQLARVQATPDPSLSPSAGSAGTRPKSVGAARDTDGDGDASAAASLPALAHLARRVRSSAELAAAWGALGAETVKEGFAKARNQRGLQLVLAAQLGKHACTALAVRAVAANAGHGWLWHARPWTVRLYSRADRSQFGWLKTQPGCSCRRAQKA